MKISVIMLSHNREEFVAEAIRSVLKQTYKDFEFIIIDNGSKDDTIRIVKTFSEQDSRIKARYLEKNMGISYGRNIGLDMASGEYVAFIDDDDIAYPEMLFFLNSLVEQNNSDIAFCGSEQLVNGHIKDYYVFKENFLFSPEDAVIELLKREKLNTAMPTKIIRRALFEQFRFENDAKYDDIRVGYKYFANANSISALGIPQYCFRKHNRNNSAFTMDDKLITPSLLREYFDAFRQRSIYLEQTMPSISDFVYYCELSFMLSMYNKIVKNDLNECHNEKRYIEQVIYNSKSDLITSRYIKDFEIKWINDYFEIR